MSWVLLLLAVFLTVALAGGDTARSRVLTVVVAAVIAGVWFTTLAH